MLRVNSNNVLVVPPFECAWLSSAEQQLHNGQGLLDFEVKGDNDITIIIKRYAGSKRWQHMQRAEPQQQERGAGGLVVDPNYTVILGSHGNRCLKIERNGLLCCMVTNAAGAHVARGVFNRFWVDYNNGIITVGTGSPAQPTDIYRWQDPEPLQGLCYVGLSSWDKHVAYRNIRVSASLETPPAPPTPTLHSPTHSSLHGRAHACTPPQSLPAAMSRHNAADCSNVPSLASLAMSSVIQTITADSALPLLVLAETPMPQQDELRSAALQVMAAQLETMAASGCSRELLRQLPLQLVQELLTHPSLTCAERVIFGFVVAWWEAQTVGSTELLDCLLPLVRFPLMSPAELQEVGAHPLACASLVLQQLLQEAAADPVAGEPTMLGVTRCAPFEVRDRRLVCPASSEQALAAARWQRRTSPYWQELIYINDGDGNGVCAYLGTNYGRECWVNPMLAGRLHARASSPSCRHTDPKALVSCHVLHTNYAGPRPEGPGASLRSWWEIDLGPQHLLVCNYYTLRHDGSAAFLRHWVLQGSVDGSIWQDLRRHNNDRSLSVALQYASWQVVGPAAAKPYRKFRVLLMGPCADTSSPYNLHLSNVELYGYFIVQGAT